MKIPFTPVKGIHFDNGENVCAIYVTYMCAVYVTFEKDLIALVKNIKFRKVKNHFQKKLQHDIEMIRTSGKTITFTDKTNNMYRLSRDQ